MLVALAPLVLVMPIWSAYFYLWAMFGVGLLLARFSIALRPVWRVMLLASLVFLSDGARRLDEFSATPGAWTWQSHVNRHYVDRALRTIRGFLGDLRTARPDLPPNSTVFFANVPVSSGWQTADGPLLRWAYADPTLRSYFLGQFTKERAVRGPVYFFAAEGDRLKDKSDDPELLRSFALTALLTEKPRAASDVLDLALRSKPEDLGLRYWRAWARWGLGDTLGAAHDLTACELRAGRRLPPGSERIVEAAGVDTAARVAALARLREEAATNGWVHARLAATLLATGHLDEGVVEAYAYRVLEPAEPDAWRKWASAQLAEQQFEAALASLTRYLELSGQRGALDREAQQAAESLRRLLRGDVAQRSLR